jgi:hypothetical protein
LKPLGPHSWRDLAATGKLGRCALCGQALRAEDEADWVDVGDGEQAMAHVRCKKLKEAKS